MASLRILIGRLLAVSIVVFVVANAEFGVVAPKLIEGAPAEKYDFAEITEPDCAPPFERLKQLVANDSPINCFVPAGEWTGMDFFLIFPSIFVLISGQIRFAMVGAKDDRMYKATFVVGVMIFCLAIMDRLGLVPVQVGSPGLAAFVPINVPPLAVQLGIAFVGCILMMGPKYWEAEGITSASDKISKRRDAARQFRTKFGSVSTPLNARSGSSSRITRSKILQKDSRLHMRRKTRKSIKIYATCPFCSGGGCSKCEMKGTL